MVCVTNFLDLWLFERKAHLIAGALLILCFVLSFNGRVLFFNDELWGLKLLGIVIENISNNVLKNTTFCQFRREHSTSTPPSINIGKTKQSPRLG